MTVARIRSESWLRIAFAASALANIAILYWPRAVSQGGVPYLDKVVHVLIFAAVAVTGVLARVPLGWLAGLLVLHAVSSELVQHWFLAHRSGDPADAAADLLGVVLGLLAGRRIARTTGVARARPEGSLST